MSTGNFKLDNTAKTSSKGKVVLIILAILGAFVGGLYVSESQKEEALLILSTEKARELHILVTQFAKQKARIIKLLGGQQQLFEKVTGMDKQKEAMNDLDAIDTSTWKTYRNEKYGFEVKYPPNYVKEENGGGYVIFYKQGPEYQRFLEYRVNNVAKEGGSPMIFFYFYENPHKLSALEWARSDLNYSNFEGTYENYQVAGQDAIKYSWSGIGGGDDLVFPSENYESIIDFGTFSKSNGADLKDDFTKMVSTFKFTK